MKVDHVNPEGVIVEIGGEVWSTDEHGILHPPPRPEPDQTWVSPPGTVIAVGRMTFNPETGAIELVPIDDIPTEPFT